MLKWRYSLLVLFLVGLFNTAEATHNRAGEITYTWLYGYTYRIKVTTYTNIGGPNLADRCYDTLYFGDGTRAVVPRTNGTLKNLCPGGPSTQPPFDGVGITSTIKLNEYVIEHTYPGPSTYVMSMTDPNRNAGVINLPNSVNQVFYIESYLVISTFMGPNSSPVLTIPPIDKGCVNKCFLHNPGASDPDGDSLSYELTYCRGFNGQMCPGYAYPATGGGGTYNVHPTTGTLTWCSPQQQGEYNLAMFIKEWRKDGDGIYRLVGYVIRDLQVDVGVCNNNPPVIRPITDTCVLAGSTVIKGIFATDPDNDIVKLTANGGPFNVGSSPATFASAPGFSPVTGTFNWQTNCSHIRKSPYQVTVKAEDQDPDINLVDFKTFNITVVAPPPLNFTATPMGTSVKLTWKKPACQNIGGNKIRYYCVYRKSDCVPWAHGFCQTGVPASSGFTKIGCTTGINDTTFIDTNNGNGLSHGTNYSYVVEAVYDDGALSYASTQVCVQLKRDVPILINVDVQTTGTSTGSIFVRWVKPLLGFNALDTIAVPGPYEFRLMHHDSFTGTFTQVTSITKPYFKAFNQLTDTTFIHTGINTDGIPHTYKIEFYANGQFIGNGQKASSVFLSIASSDNTLSLSWQQQVPWVNFKYYIYKKDPSQTSFVLKDSTTALTYIDDTLVNGALYCYKVLAKGEYSDPNIYRPLLNYSQEVCARPIDTTPPCSPTLTIQSDCKKPALSLIWNNPNHVCSDDAVKYRLYFSETEDVPLALWDSVLIMNDTMLTFDNLESIAGCYAITAVDSFSNESLQSEKICVDNCPEYELPNVITLNGDGVNDFFKPIINKFVKDIDLKIYNRWGNLVYETTDPKIMWDGKSMQMKEIVTEGTYFYVCQVNEIRVAGIKSRYLKGFLQVFHK
jgi:gliding motility-associated-like protein